MARQSPDAVTRTCEFWLGRDHLLARFLPGARVSGEDARENLAATARLAAGSRLLIVVDLRPVLEQSADARAVLAGPEASMVSRAVALVVGSPLSRVVGNFYLRFNRPETPTRLFDDEPRALRWLRSLPVAAERADAS